MSSVEIANPIDLVVKGGTLVIPSGEIPGWVAVQSGKITAIGGPETPAPPSTKVIDARGLYVLPGIIDPEGHPGNRPSLEDSINESRAAAAAGITTWGLQTTATSMMVKPLDEPGPEDIRPYADLIPTYIDICSQRCATDYFLTPRIMNDAHAAEIPDMAKKYGINSFKSYLHLRTGTRVWHMWGTAKTMGQFAFDDGMVYLAMKNIARLGGNAVYCLHCENWEIARVIAAELQKQGRKDMAAWCDHSPAFCEAGHVRTYAYYAGVTGCPIYIQHTTTPETVEEIIKAKAEGVRVFSQTGPHYLSLDKNVWKINVPLRDRAAIDKCWQLLAEGHIDCIGSDHVTTAKGKLKEDMEVKGDVWATQSGFPSRVEALLPVMLSEGVNKKRITLKRLVEVCSENPAKIFGLYPRKGAIAVGSDADVVLVDLDRTRTLTRDMVHSAIGWSMWEGWEIKGWPVMTILRGNVIAEWPEGEPRSKIIGRPLGKYLPRRI